MHPVYHKSRDSSKCDFEQISGTFLVKSDSRGALFYSQTAFFGAFIAQSAVYSEKKESFCSRISKKMKNIY